MNRVEFEALRDLPGKRIVRDIVLKPKKQGAVVYSSGAVPVEAEAGMLANLYIEYNDATGAKTVNVMIVGVGQFADWMSMAGCTSLRGEVISIH